MSPEQISGEALLDGRADVYSLACVLHEMLAGTPPFSGSSAHVILAKHLTATPTPIRAHNPKQPVWLDEALACALAKEPSDRYASARQFADSLVPRERAAEDRRASKSIAVLPFANVGADPDDEYFSDGIAEDIISRLSRIRDLKVISRRSSMQYRNQAAAIPEIAAQLGVETILEGSVRRIGNRVRVTAQLIDAATDRQFWAESYDRDLTDVFAIQTDIAERIAASLKAELSSGEQGQLRRQQQRDPEAYNLYLRGRHLLHRWTADGWQKGIDSIRAALGRDPHFAAGHAAVALAYAQSGYFGVVPPEGSFPIARAAATEAIRIDPSTSDAHAALGLVQYWFDWDWNAAAESLQRAIQLDPGQSLAHTTYGMLLDSLKRSDDAMRERTIALDRGDLALRSPALALAWEFQQRHRWGLIAITVYLVALTAIRLLVLDPARPLELDSAETFAFVVIVPMTSAMVYFLAVFTFGLSGDLAGRQSMYPARMLTLPVTTAALAGWPMLYGGLAVTLLWMAVRLLGLWPAGIHVPSIWPAPLAAVLLAWTQVLMWMPYGLRGMRVIVVVLWLTVIDTVVLLAIHLNASEWMMIAGLVPQLPLAYLAARHAVARARRGDVPDWRRGSARSERVASTPARRRENFRSPARAQMWFEWRRHGLSLPVLVAILLPFELALLFAATDAPVLVLYILLGVLLTPPFMAAFTAASVRKTNPYASDSLVVTPFLATRPLTSAALIAAKLKAMMLSTLAAWVLVLIAVPVALVWSDTWPMVSERARAVIDFIGQDRAVVILLLILSGFIASTWKQLVQSLYIGLTGREWVMRASVFLTLSFIVLLGPLLEWMMTDSDVQVALWDSIPLILVILVGLKVSAAVMTAVRHYRNPLLSDRTLVSGAAIWCAAVLALHGLLVWIVDTPLFPSYLLALVAILAIPLARLSAAPLALAWNRHR